MPAVIESADIAKAEEPVFGDFVCAFLLLLTLVSVFCSVFSSDFSLFGLGFFSSAATALLIFSAIKSTSACSVMFLPLTTALTAASTSEKSL